MRIAAFALALWIAGTALGAQSAGITSSIVMSPHNLSARGPGRIRAIGEQEVCVFCHTPHNALPVQPLWNRRMSVTSYRVYASNSLQAKPGQPTGWSKLCLSCHDGTIALGSVYSRGQIIQMAGGVTMLPPGKTNLGTDLRDDHPISFRYDTTLTTKNPKLRNPGRLPPNVHLDANQELQCTSCHDAHDNSKGSFLVMDNSSSQLCNSCHTLGPTTVTNHINCSSCHQSHSAPSGPYLLKKAKVSETCLTCHDGGTTRPQGPNIAADLQKISKHDTNSRIDAVGSDNVNCADCHEPHSMTSIATVAPNIPGSMGKVRGVNTGGAPVNPARFEYEVCFKCHADRPAAVRREVTRQLVQTNMRLQMDYITAISFHPVEGAGKNPSAPTLKSGLTAGSIIFCGDCHGSNTSKTAGGSGPNGIHGSSDRPVLLARYETMDNTSESTSSYALCYRCHDRNKLIDSSQSQTDFPLHRLHIVDKRTPCAACHDPHGISRAQGTTTNNAHLINFATTIATPARINGIPTLKYVKGTAPRSGACFLTCHNSVHAPKTYGSFSGAAAGVQAAPLRNSAASPPPPGLPPAGTSGGRAGWR